MEGIKQNCHTYGIKLIALAGSGLLYSCSIQGQKPNILFIITDQQSAKMMSCAGNSYLKTPSMDRIAANGTRFELAYSPNPVSVPSRTSMMTGYFPSTFRFETNQGGENATITDQVLANTLGKLLQKEGYETVFGGKTHWAKGLNYTTCGFEKLTSDTYDGLAVSCAEYLRKEHGKPFF